MTRWIARPAARNDAAEFVRRGSQVARPPGGSVGGAFTTFRPRRWRIFALLFVMYPTLFACLGAILYAGGWWPGWQDSTIFFVCLLAASQVGMQTWRTPERGAVYVSDAEIINAWGRTILLADLDRVRSAKRGPIDRILGQQYFYSTSGKRIYLWRVVFDGPNLRRLLDLLHLDQGNMS